MPRVDVRSEALLNLMAVVSGLLLTAAFPKLEFSALAWAAFLPVLWALRDAGPREGFRRGMVFGIAHYLSLLYWLVPTMTIYGHLPLPLAIGILFLFASVLSLLSAAPCFGALALVAHSPMRLLVAFPVLWTAAEFLRSFLFTGFPWELLGYSQYRNLPLIQVADVLGVYGISALIALSGAALYLVVAAVTGTAWKGAAVTGRLAAGGAAAALVLAAAAWGYGSARIEQIDRLTAEAPNLRAAVIQGNIEQSEKWDPASQAATIDKYLRLSQSVRSQNPELIVWPESAAPFYFLSEGPPTRAVMQGVAAAGTYFLIGAPSFELKGRAADYFNSAYLVGPGEILGKYDKAHLVPYGEYTPFKDYLPFLGKIVEHVGDFKAGVEGHTLSLAGRRLGIQICYEVIFPELARAQVRNGAVLLLTITNDAWYGQTAGPYQHFSIAVMRAVENRRALARAANTGISGFIDPVGRVLDPTPLEVDAAVVRALPLLQTESIYTRYGDVLGWVCLGLAVIAVAQARRPKRTRPKAGGCCS
jgi:apolipoprotein N-acyltransferase